MSDLPVKITVKTYYLEEHSDPEQDHYVFSYHIEIHNQGKEDLQLLERHWLIRHANGKMEEVRGAGVVGKQPWILPGESFRYASHCVLQTDVGTMEGEYTMKNRAGDTLEIPIDTFTLTIPRVLH